MKECFFPTRYQLQSLHSGRIYDDEGWMLEAPDEEKPALLRAVYEKKQIEFRDDSWGLYKFADWLPVKRILKGSSAPVTYKSESLAGRLNLKNLWITFSGYWPERKGLMRTCSFKETEAYSVCGRMDENENKILVVASAGNTARSFAKVCSDNNIPLLICVPEKNIDALWFDAPLNNCVKLIVSGTGSDYFDAIHLSNLVTRVESFVPEGGAKNVARRDGMATTVLSAVAVTGAIPAYYFQAIGSGTGAIAAWEANLRLLQDGRFGNNKMKLMLSQNEPFIPIYEAWKAHSRNILAFDDNVARKQVEAIKAKVLSNRKPPYAVHGGLYDALVDTLGEVLITSNQELDEAAGLFLETEGIDIHPAAAVATATLLQCVRDNTIDPEASVMLNITGGGEQRFAQDNDLWFLKPDLVFDIDPDENEVEKAVKTLFA